MQLPATAAQSEAAPPYAEGFGNRLRSARGAEGQRLREAAEQIRCRVDTLSRIELGRNTGLSFAVLGGIVRWADKHAISLPWLLLGAAAMKASAGARPAGCLGPLDCPIVRRVLHSIYGDEEVAP